jgi:hypothetical protein
MGMSPYSGKNILIYIVAHIRIVMPRQGSLIRIPMEASYSQIMSAGTHIDPHDFGKK